MAQVNCPLRATAIQDGARTALWLTNDCISYRQLDGYVSAAARQLAQQDLRPGTHLGVIGHNSLAMIILLLACLRSGVIFCPLNPRFPGRQLRGLAARLDLDAVWSEPPQASLGCPPFHLRLTMDLDPCKPLALRTERACDMILTSGSSGDPKAAVHCLGNHLASAHASASRLPLPPESCWLLSLPLFHIGGYAIVIRTLLAGSSMALGEGRSLEQVVAQAPLTHLSLVNTQLQRLLRSPAEPLRSGTLHHLLLGGGPVRAELIRQATALGLTCWTTYGMTEMSSQITTGPVTGDEQPLPSGALLPARELQIDAQHRIKVRGAPLFLGYYHDGKTVAAQDEDGWFHTGDKGYWLGKNLVIEGRADNMFISGGENIQPEAIEQVLSQHPAVSQVIVVPRPDPEYGARPVAFIQWHASSVAEPALRQWMRQRLPPFMCPVECRPWPHEVTEAGLKVRRRDFQALL